MAINMSVEYGKLHDENVRLRMINDSLLNALKDAQQVLISIGMSDFVISTSIKKAIKKAEQ